MKGGMSANNKKPKPAAYDSTLSISTSTSSELHTAQHDFSHTADCCTRADQSTFTHVQNYEKTDFQYPNFSEENLSNDTVALKIKV